MIKDQIIKALSKTFGGQDFTLLTPKQDSFGDFAINIKQLQSIDPKINIKSVIDQLKKIDLFSSVEETREFINFWLSNKILLENLNQISKGDNIIKSSAGKGKKIIVEYSSPNIAKPFTIGHLRSTVIGDAIANLLEAVGYKVFRDNHVGDWGTQFGKQICALKKWGDETTIEKSDKPVKLLVDLYVKFHQEAEENPKLDGEAREWFRKLETGDSEARRIWERCVDWSWIEFDKIYKTLGVIFTENKGRGYEESYFEDKMKPVIDEIEQKKLLKENEGAKLVYFDKDEYPPLMILKKDDSTLYSTRDLATDKFRLEKYGPDIVIINEVGTEQSLYFQQLFKVEEMLGWFKKGQRIHIKHGMYRFKDQKMSTRSGNVIWLEDVLGEAEKRAAKISESQGRDVAKQVGIGAIKWNDLKKTSSQDVVFNWDDLLNMKGNSGPYLQYTYARTQSVISKALIKPKIDSCDFKLRKEEQMLIKELVRFQEIIELAATQYAPNVLCNYLYSLAKQFNLFYEKLPILKADEKTLHLRLAITIATGKILKRGLNILGIDAPNTI